MVYPSSPLTYWQSLAVAADRGQLFLNSEAAAACNKACEDYIDKLKLSKNKAGDLANADGWGEFESGKQIRKLFSEKAIGGKNNMVDVLQSHIDVVEQMQAVFRKFFVLTYATDSDNASDLQQHGPN
ncbi:hypothetical protein QMK17_22225 [Rhodococcus sp. G-MC3]|uniref:hypothetical protein n=1 Tax=Rhodococcus sp. G-MC3 TaxID=3046209 RepID=UPI0024BA2845|nr:hypothetical protein [Rhodococcus sp. G-MC3]MDJ0396043.1 hypothetical protein [Rhodococcus sp. G-MC3]